MYDPGTSQSAFNRIKRTTNAVKSPHVNVRIHEGL